MALRSDGSLISWGRDADGQVTGTPTTGTYRAIAAGGHHSVALRSDGTLISWGWDGRNQVTGTPTQTDFWAVAAGGYHNVAIRTDPTPPVIAPRISGLLGENGWYVSDVAVGWTVVDEESEITSQTGCGPTTISSDTDSNGTTLTCQATSGGGTASVSLTIRRDVTPPTLAPSVSPNPVLLGGSATASANATDALSGMATENCGALNTGTVGTRTVTCTATDNAGNQASASVSYSVVYAFSGFSAPVNDPPVLNVANAGQAIPLRWQLLDANGAPVTDLAGVTLTVSNLACALGSGDNEVTESAAGRSGLLNLGDGNYQFNWQTPRNYANSCRTLHLDLGEGTTRTARFQFTR